MSESFEKVIGFGDHYGTRASVSVFDEGEDTAIQFSVEAGQCGGRGYPTPESARQIAAALLDAADRMEGAAA